MRATRAIIHLENLKANIRAIRSHIGERVKMCIAVKADAYGHGAIPVARAAEELGVECLGVATTDEGLELVRAGIRAHVLLLSVPLPEEIPAIVAEGIIPIASDARTVELIANEAARRKRKVGIHIKLDTGMGRLGIRPEAARAFAEMIERSGSVTIGGMCTHFPASDTADRSFTEMQIERFLSAVEQVRAAGIDPGMLHAANSGAVLSLPLSYFNMVRPGILVYGYYPSDEQERTIAVKPVMEFATKVVLLKEVDAETPVSYGMTYRTKSRTTIATLPVGYGDGYSRLLSNRARVTIRGNQYPVVGRVCMDHTMVELGTAHDIEVNDDVVLFGPAPGSPDAAEIANLMGTIPYEVTCLITKRVPRIHVEL